LSLTLTRGILQLVPFLGQAAYSRNFQEQFQIVFPIHPRFLRAVRAPSRALGVRLRAAAVAAVRATPVEIAKTTTVVRPFARSHPNSMRFA
jgi:hypothetical protein